MQIKGWTFWQTINNAIIPYDSMPACCFVKVVKRSLDDTEAEILNDKGEPEQREAPRAVLQEDPAAKAGRDPVREERISIRLESVTEQ